MAGQPKAGHIGHPHRPLFAQNTGRPLIGLQQGFQQAGIGRGGQFTAHMRRQQQPAANRLAQHQSSLFRQGSRGGRRLPAGHRQAEAGFHPFHRMPARQQHPGLGQLNHRPGQHLDKSAFLYRAGGKTGLQLCQRIGRPRPGDEQIAQGVQGRNAAKQERIGDHLCERIYRLHQLLASRRGRQAGCI